LTSSIKHICKSAFHVLAYAALAACMLFVLSGCSGTQQENAASKKTAADFANARIAVITGSYQQTIAEKTWPAAQLQCYQTAADLFAAVLADKADCALVSEPAYRTGTKDHPELVISDDVLPSISASFIWPKGSSETELFKQMNSFIARMKADGTFDQLMEDWQGDDESKKTIPPVSDLSGENGTLSLITSANEEPYEYWNNNRIVGLDIDIAYRFCQEYGYTYTIEDIPFESLIMGLSQSRYDFCPAMVIYTEERAQSVDFGEPMLTSNNVIVYLDDNAASRENDKDIITSLASSFQRTFVSENRWQMILGGLGVTLLVALLSAIFGTLIGFGLAILRHYSGKKTNAVVDVYVRFLQGMPVLVLLLIFYYIVFGSQSVSSIFVSVIVFSLNTSANICENLYSRIRSVHPGQREAAIASGYTETQAFYRFVLPVALQRALPVYTGEMVSLVKGTSIVGYIALIDLTKAGDIIRSRTYDALFPLIVIALIYLLVTWIVSLLLQMLERALTPERPKKSIKGVTLQK